MTAFIASLDPIAVCAAAPRVTTFLPSLMHRIKWLAKRIAVRMTILEEWFRDFEETHDIKSIAGKQMLMTEGAACSVFGLDHRNAWTGCQMPFRKSANHSTDGRDKDDTQLKYFIVYYTCSRSLSVLSVSEKSCFLS